MKSGLEPSSLVPSHLPIAAMPSQQMATVIALASVAASRAAPAGLRGQAMQDAVPNNSSANSLMAWNLNGSDATEFATSGFECCSRCPNHSFCSPQSGNCYNRQYKSYYIGCGGGGGGIQCCSKCPHHPFCSPHSGNCYNGKYKSYYIGCGSGGGGAPAPAPPPAVAPAPAPAPAPVPPPPPASHSWGCGCEWPYDVCSLTTCYMSQNCYFSRRLEAKVGDMEGGVETTIAGAGNVSLQALTSVGSSAGSTSRNHWNCVCQGAAGFCSHTACYMQCYS